MTKYHRVKSLDELAVLCGQEPRDFWLVLNGNIGSRKTIRFQRKTKQFRIKNHIDDSTQLLTTKQLDDDRLTLIGKAISFGALFWEE